MPVAHRPESLAYRIADAAWQNLVYSGDSDVCEGLTDHRSQRRSDDLRIRLSG
jgi:ribonuclease BN (tRNA processing enzyme)